MLKATTIVTACLLTAACGGMGSSMRSSTMPGSMAPAQSSMSGGMQYDTRVGHIGGADSTWSEGSPGDLRGIIAPAANPQTHGSPGG